MPDPNYFKQGSGKIFIAGGGKAKDSYLIDKEFVRSLKNCKLLYLPIGLKRDIIGYEECYEWITGTLGAHKDKNIDIEMWTNLVGKYAEDLSEFDSVYIGGANNTYRLMNILQETKMASSLKTFVKNGGNIYGGSSGAIMLGKNIETWGGEAGGYTDYIGLNLVGGWSIFCHYCEENISRLKLYLKKYKLPTIALPENSGFIYDHDNGSIQVIGYSPITVFPRLNTSFKVNPDKELSLDRFLL